MMSQMLVAYYTCVAVIHSWVAVKYKMQNSAWAAVVPQSAAEATVAVVSAAVVAVAVVYSRI